MHNESRSIVYAKLLAVLMTKKQGFSEVSMESGDDALSCRLVGLSFTPALHRSEMSAL